MRYDIDNERIEPHILKQRMLKLGLFTSTNSDGAPFDALMLTSVDLNKLEENRDWRNVYLMRYGRQQYSEIRDMPIDEIWRLVKQVGKFIKEESATERLTSDSD